MNVFKRETVAPMPDVLDPRVVRGAELLDERMPGWAEKVNPDTLDIDNYCGCIIGQTHGVRDTGDCGWRAYYVALESLGLFGDGTDVTDEVAHGFYSESKEQDALTQDWRLVILSRRSA